MDERKKISIAADHGGYELKEEVKKFLQEQGFLIEDFGTDSAESCDYPDFGYKAAKAVQEKKADIGIVICKSGLGMGITANKLKGIRAAVCFDVEQAHSAREHNCCNVLALGANRVNAAEAKEIIQMFVNTPFGGERHQRRVSKIEEIENI